MTDKIQSLKAKRDQLNARIQQAEARVRAGQTKADNRVKVLVGAAILEQVKRGGVLSLPQLLELMQGFLERPSEREAVLGKEGQGSEALRRLVGEGEA